MRAFEPSVTWLLIEGCFTGFACPLLFASKQLGAALQVGLDCSALSQSQAF